jgi:quinol monooxygenase YgiN
MKEMLTVVARLRAKPGREEEVKKALLDNVAPSRAERGCIDYDLHQSHEDPALFLFYENWESQEDLDAHSQSAHIQALRSRAGELLAEPALIELFRPLH